VATSSHQLAPPPPFARRFSWRRIAASPYLLLVPAVVAMGAVAVYPLIYSIRASFHRYRFGLDFGSAGTQNYSNVFHDSTFWTAIGTTAKFVGLAVTLETLLGLGLALLVSREIRFGKFFRVTLILPMTIAPVVVGVVWRLMYASDIGIVNPIFSGLGLGTPDVLAHETSAFLGVVAVDVWEWTPLLFLIILAGLQSLPQEPLEAARVDGAGPVRSFFDHTLPLLFPARSIRSTCSRRAVPARPPSSSPPTRTTRPSSSPSTGRRRRCWWRCLPS
jgi:multiple sugar transport system permease protein